MEKRLVSFAILALALYICRTLFVPILLGGVFAALLYPGHRHWVEKFRRSAGESALLLTLFFSFCLLGPFSFLLFLGAKAGLQELRALKLGPSEGDAGVLDRIVEAPLVKSALEKISGLVPVSVEDLNSGAHDFVSAVSARLTDALGSMVSQIPTMGLGLLILVISVYFFLKDGKKLHRFVMANSVYSPVQTESLIANFVASCRSAVLASVASGAVQAILFLVGCVFCGVNNIALITFCVFMGSFIPVVGAAPLTFGVALNQFISGHRVSGFVLLSVACIASISDNIVRPAVLKGASMHPLVVFVAVFGGIEVFGFAGVFLGPILVSLAVQTLNHVGSEPTRS